MSNWFKNVIDADDNDQETLRRIIVVYSMILITLMLIFTGAGVVFPEIAWITIGTLAGAFTGASVLQQRVNKIKDKNKEELKLNEDEKNKQSVNDAFVDV